MSENGAFRLRLPATSANLGSGFDAVAVALDFDLEVHATASAQFSIEAEGRDAVRCRELKDNLILSVYQKLLFENERPVVPLALHIANGIPLGMGCGSSAAGRLAGVALAVHFGHLGWDSERVLKVATSLEGHPDNVAACWLGGFVATAWDDKGVRVAAVDPPSAWRAVIVLPRTPLPTSQARAVLPDSYTRADVVSNIQAVSMLGLAFAQGRGDLLRSTMRDRIHQPYRSAMCPLLPALLPLAGDHGILGVALSGAGPAVLVIVEGQQSIEQASRAIEKATHSVEEAELLICRFKPSLFQGGLR